MPAKKAARQSIKRAQRNRSARSATRTGIAKALQSMEAGDVGNAETAVTEALSLLDKAVQKGVVHKNTASRGKSRLSLRLNRFKAANAA